MTSPAPLPEKLSRPLSTGPAKSSTLPSRAVRWPELVTSGWPSEGTQTVDWLVVNFFWGDELCVPPNHPDSNERLARQALLERVGAANAVYPMRCDEGLDAYQLRLGEIGQLDVVHLVLGPDGSIAGLFPELDGP